MGKSCSFGLQYVFCTMSSLNKGDVHNCRLYDTIEIDTRVCVQVVYELLEKTKFCIYIIIDKINVGIVNRCFSQICNRVTTLD